MNAIALVLALAAVATGSPAAPPSPSCRPALVHEAPYPGHGKGLEGIPWIEGSPREVGLVGLLWYWPPRWRDVRRARVYTGGTAPQGWNIKIMWVFLEPSAKGRAGAELTVRGTRLDGPGTIRDTFAGIGYEGARGAPSYASVVDVPEPGCWRLTLTTGDLSATVDVRAVVAR